MALRLVKTHSTCKLESPEETIDSESAYVCFLSPVAVVHTSVVQALRTAGLEKVMGTPPSELFICLKFQSIFEMEKKLD